MPDSDFDRTVRELIDRPSAAKLGDILAIGEGPSLGRVIIADKRAPHGAREVSQADAIKIREARAKMGKKRT